MGVRSAIGLSLNRLSKRIEMASLDRQCRQHYKRALLRFPFLSTYFAHKAELETELASDRDRYVNEISSDQMAISLECAALLAHVCRELRPKAVLDLGSGFSSHVVRRYCAQGSEIISVDDDEYWLKQAVKYLVSNGMSADSLCTWDEFVDSAAGVKDHFDLVVHDIGRMNLREGSLVTALGCARRETGIVILDDMHKKPYRDHATATLGGMNCEYYHLGELVKDKYGRWATLVANIKD